MKFETILELKIGDSTSPRLVCWDYELDEFPHLNGQPRIEVYGTHVLIGTVWTACDHLWDVLSDAQREWIEARMAEGWNQAKHVVVVRAG